MLCLAIILSLFSVGASAQNSSIVNTFSESFGGKEYTVRQGYYYYGDYLPYYYSDGYFEGDSTSYNIHLSTMSLNLALAGMHIVSDTRYGHGAARQLLCEIGCGEDSVRVNESSIKFPERFSIAYTMGSKELTYANGASTGYTLIPVVVRGGGYWHEWYSNGILGESGDAKGFSLAADEVLSGIEAYIEEFGLEGRQLKFWVTGYSRAAAVSDLVAKRLVDKYSTGAVYGYTFETPIAGTESGKAAGKNYNCIHNVVNYADLVTYVAPSGMGFVRYGQDHVFPFADDTCTSYAASESVYNTRKAAMLTQAAQLNYTLDESFDVFDAYSFDTELSNLYWWELAELLVDVADLSNTEGDLTSALLDAGLLTKRPYSASRDVSYNKLTGDYMQTLLRQTQQWAASSRANYAVNPSKLAGGTDCNAALGTHGTVEKGIALVADIFFNKSYSQLTTLMKRAEVVLDEYTVSADDISLDLFTEKWDLYGPIFSMLLNWNKPSADKTTIVKTLVGIPLLKAPAINDTVRLQYISDFYNKVFTAIALQDGDDYLTPQEMDELKDEWATLFNMALSFMSADYNTTANSYGFSAGGDGRTVMLCSLLMNPSSVEVHHQPLTTLAWIRSYDSYYNTGVNACVYGITDSSEAPTIYIADTAVSSDPSKPTVLPAGETVTLDVASTVGETIYYTLENITGGTTAAEKLYTGSVLMPDTGEDTLCKITAHDWSYSHTSADTVGYIMLTDDYSAAFENVEICDAAISFTVTSDYCLLREMTVTACAYKDGKAVQTSMSDVFDLSLGSYTGSVPITVDGDCEYRLFLLTDETYMPLGIQWSSRNDS